MKKLLIYTVLVSVCFLTSCSKFLDINDDPNNPTTAKMSELLPSIQANLAGAVGSSVGGLGNYTSLYTHQTTQRGLPDNFYNFNANEFGVTIPWTLFYTYVLTDISELIKLAEVSNSRGYIGVCKVMKAYTFATLVDIYGDVPYFRANLGAEETHPKFDPGSDIYEDVLLLLTNAIEDLNAATESLAGDLIYGGNYDKWRKLANTLKLKMYTHMRHVANVSLDVNTLLAHNDLIGAGDDFEFRYGTSVSPDNRNPGYSQEWGPRASRNNINPFFFEIMNGINTFNHGNDIYANLTDPRIPYYFYNQLATGESPENPCSYCPARSGTNFLSIWMFSFDIDENEGFDQAGSRTLMGLYPVGGRYDDGSAVKANFNGPGNIPQRILPYYTHLFLRAELAQAGVTSEDARTLFEEAIRAAFAKVNTIASGAGAPVIGGAAIDNYVAEVLSRFDVASIEGKMEHIITQKWIANFGASIDSYNDYRRTGYPKLHNPDTDNLDFTTSAGYLYPFSYPWPQDELNTNPNAPSQKRISEYKVFWNN